ncbi:recombination helicase AddA Firmicutes type [Eubacterium sp. CAG:581]|nr:recombination helicase AddA Firmicutes type [Eubacterium sp. CAG:581]
MNSEEKVQEECDTTTTQDTEVTDDYIDTIIKDRLEYKYKNEGINAIPTKVAVSDISHNISKERFKKVLARPDFMSEKSMTPTERGTAVHSALQYIDFKNARNDFDGEIERLVSKGFITKRQGEVLDRNKLLNLVNSPLTDRIVNSEKVYREFKFYTKILAKDALENVPENFSEQKIILQGAVDLALVEDDSLVIVDYKTDRIKDVSELKELYSQQLLLYKNAMEQCTPYKVSKCIIYSITLGEFVEV